MNYELAKELKDAGFPQGVKEQVRDCFYFGEDGELRMWPWGDKEPELTGFTKSPSLSELIEACGEGFDDLWGPYHNEEHKRTGYWRANGFMLREDWKHHSDPHTHPAALGSTPEEAVARLWLALNKAA